MTRFVLDPKTGKYIEAPLLPTSDEMLQRALEHPPGSELRRSYIEAALMLEPRPRRGRPKGTGTSWIDDTVPFILMKLIAQRTGERAAERLASHAVDTGLVVEKEWQERSAISRLAKGWRRHETPLRRKWLDKDTAKILAEKGCLEDAKTVVCELGHDPFLRKWSKSRRERATEK